ncbi:nuclear transport factor 2 family protein [Hymenobacter sp.]|uniref:nuclear transport factor 2 family protein n=1 Tax=Hymenobacter sp. TaxID=1898978 RepID=UPI00286A0437|nr:nuclear transport factor 2 family protein [Hymenobacter sp.]
MQRIIVLFALLVILAATDAHAQTAAAQTADVKKTITAFFEGMRQGDSTAVRRTLAPGAVFHTIAIKAGVTKVAPENPLDFLKAVGSPHPKVWDERITFASILVDANLASVWTPYEFYFGGTFSHCGYNSFQLVKLADGWKIAHVIDTRRKEKCQ